MTTFSSIPILFKATVNKFPTNTAVSFVNEKELTYIEVRVLAERLAEQLIKLNVQKGDRVAILSPNMPQWSIAYLGITSIGAISVPLMPDFRGHEIQRILEHSGAKLVIVSAGLSKHVPPSYNSIAIEELDNINAVRDEKADGSFKIGDIDIHRDDIASIIYTSGTTGDPKGVMLSHGNILFTASGGAIIQPINSNDRFLSVLPLSHIYEFTIGLVMPFAAGASVSYLRKPPTAQILIPALQSVKPTFMLTVPLIIEKIFWKSVYPKFNENILLRSLYKVGFIRRALHKIAGKKVRDTFGSSLKFYGIGGSKLDGRVETFLRDARFPYAIGYGLTETAPLLAGGSPGKFAWQSTGTAMKGVELKINEPDLKSGIGEVIAKGENVMKGYYQNPELTAEAFTRDGWFRTGDLGYIDKKGQLFLKGRIKTTIIGANGKNIFPEEIENIINSRNFVKESLVIEQKGKLTGLVHLDYEAIEAHLSQLREDTALAVREKVNEILNEIHIYVNQQVNQFSRLQVVVEQQVPFEHTPTQKIKRFLYQ